MTGSQPPRVVFLGACRAIGESLARAGFRGQRQNQLLVRSRGPWRHEIAIASSHFNQTGKFVAITPTVIVRNSELAIWRQSTEDGRADDFVTSRMVYQFANRSGTTWDLADPITRSRVLDEVVEIIEEKAVARFDLFDERLEFLDRWKFDHEVLELDVMAELLIFLDRRRDAVSIVIEAMNREPWSLYAPLADAFRRLRALAELHSLELPVPAEADLTEDVARLRAALDTYSGK